MCSDSKTCALHVSAKRMYPLRYGQSERPLELEVESVTRLLHLSVYAIIVKEIEIRLS